MQDVSITQELVDEAKAQESELHGSSIEVLTANVNYLNRRVVMLRALVNAQEARIKELEGDDAEDDPKEE